MCYFLNFFPPKKCSLILKRGKNWVGEKLLHFFFLWRKIWGLTLSNLWKSTNIYKKIVLFFPPIISVVKTVEKITNFFSRYFFEARIKTFFFFVNMQNIMQNMTSSSLYLKNILFLTNITYIIRWISYFKMNL